MKRRVKKVFSALSTTVLCGSMVIAPLCFLKLMFYTNVPKHVETVLYVTCGIMLAYMFGFIVKADESDVEY